MERTGTRAAREVIGIVGLGSLGLPLASNLLRAGFEVVGYARRPSSGLPDLGGRLAPSVVALADECRTIVTCLPSPEALADVISGAGNLRGSVAQDSIVIDVSTLPVAVKREQRDALAEAGAAMLDCGISGNHRYVANWTAGLFASGPRAVFDRCSHVLAAMTPRVTYVGEFGTGTTLKLVASLLVPVHTLAAAEALALAERAGVDPRLALSALQGTQASSGMLESRGARMAAGDFSGPPLADYFERNVRATLELARTVGGRYPLLERMADCYRDAIARGLGDLDQSAMLAYLGRLSGDVERAAAIADEER
jgi:3-hydroxyisobutyrate dehydrogenase-like beta-hydroxyacid dehydrogenase